MMKISIIVAVDEDNGIGKNNALMWHISEDLKRFKQITENHTVVMGRKTYMSLPFKPLKNRRNIVVSKSEKTIDKVEVVDSLGKAVDLCKNEEEVFIIGGASIYQQFIDIADKIYLTKVFEKYEADTFFPSIDQSVWQTEYESEVFFDEKSNLKFQFINYLRQQ